MRLFNVSECSSSKSEKRINRMMMTMMISSEICGAAQIFFDRTNDKLVEGRFLIRRRLSFLLGNYSEINLMNFLSRISQATIFIIPDYVCIYFTDANEFFVNAWKKVG